MAEGRLSASASDDELVQRVALRDTDALAALFRRYYPVVYRFALHVIGAAAQAEDVAQEVFIAVMRDADRYETGRSSVAAWLCGIARNQARRRLERDRGLLPLHDADGDGRVCGSGVTVDSDPLGDLIDAARAEALRKAVMSLPLKYRETIALCDLEEMSYQDAAGALNCAVGTVRSRLHRARRLLAMKLRAPDAHRSPSKAPPGCVA